MRVGLVGCVKSKQATPAPAGELYTSALFRGRRTAVEASCDRWFVLSALHGLVRPDDELEPYDVALTDRSVAARREWSSQVLAALADELGELGSHEFEMHAGAAYTDHGLVAGLRATRAIVELPVAGLSLGRQLAWYADRDPGGRRAVSGQRRRVAPASDGPSGSGGRYGPLRRHLAGSAAPEVTLTFGDIEELIGRSLPASARRHRAWWSNGSSSQSRAWLDAGCEVDRVDQRVGWVRFRRIG